MSGLLPVLLFTLLAAVAAAGLAYAWLLPRIAAEKKTESRLNHYKGAETDSAAKRLSRDRLQEVAKRRRTLQTSLKEIESKQKERDNHVAKLSLERRIAQAGWKLTVRQFALIGAATGAVSGLVALFFGLPWIAVAGIALSAGFGLPRWLLASARKRRQQKFVDEFANAIDVIVRGIKSGLPLNDTLRMIAAETPEPVRSEFERIVESQQMGMSTSEAVERLYQSMPLAETNFFSIVVTIQAQAGGNLAEALANLSRVLRERKKMKAKIQAMSMEAKASGGIIGALPIVVGALVYITTPDYISALFVTTTGNMILLASGLWMLTGILVMKKMINFDF